MIKNPYHLSCDRHYFRRKGDMIIIHPKSWNLAFKVHSQNSTDPYREKSLILAICSGYNIDIVGKTTTIRFSHEKAITLADHIWEVTYKPDPELNLKWFLRACIKQKKFGSDDPGDDDGMWEGVS